MPSALRTIQRVQWNPKHEPIQLRTEETPQLQHIRDHLRGSQGGMKEEKLDGYMRIVPMLCEPRSLQSIADEMEARRIVEGSDKPWTRRMVETVWYNVAEILLMIPAEPSQHGFQDYGSYRIALVLQVHGIRRCWCEF